MLQDDPNPDQNPQSEEILIEVDPLLGADSNHEQDECQQDEHQQQQQHQQHQEKAPDVSIQRQEEQPQQQQQQQQNDDPQEELQQQNDDPQEDLQQEETELPPADDVPGPSSLSEVDEEIKRIRRALLTYDADLVNLKKVHYNGTFIFIFVANFNTFFLI